MNMEINLNVITTTVVAGLILTGGRFLLSRLTEIRDHLAAQNNRLTKSETWQSMHEDQDTQRFTDLQRGQDELLKSLREQRGR